MAHAIDMGAFITEAEAEENAKDLFVQRYGSMICDLHAHMLEMPMDMFLLLGEALVSTVGVVSNERTKQNAAAAQEANDD